LEKRLNEIQAERGKLFSELQSCRARATELEVSIIKLDGAAAAVKHLIDESA
jgi:hypothetical protein